MTTIPEALVPGLFAVSDPELTHPEDTERMMSRVVGTHHDFLPASSPDGVSVAVWGEGPGDLVHRGWSVLAASARRNDNIVGGDEVAAILRAGDSGAFQRLLPPIAAVVLDASGFLVAATDHLGLRQVFYASTPGRAAVSTSSSVLARWMGAALDQEALAVQSLLGWQIGERSFFEGVARLPANSRVRLGGGRLEVLRSEAPIAQRSRVTLAEAVDEAASLLTTYLTRCVEDHPDVLFQLSGGLDSRILLAAIPRDLRRGLRAMTIGGGSNSDVVVARVLADRCGLDHIILPLDGLESLSPVDAFRTCVDASRRLEYVADPLLLAAIRHAEDSLVPETRIGGVGGEAARGFYHTGPVLPVPTGRLVSQLVARYRMFTNERVSEQVLEPGFAAWARRFTEGEIARVLASLDHHFYQALDDFYVQERLQRWAGATATAVVFDRTAIHPMLDFRFLQIVRSLPPEQKAGNRFAAKLVMKLDAELGHIELDDRPAPKMFASLQPIDRGKMYIHAGGKFVRKVGQKYGKVRRPPVGAPVLAKSINAYWRASPSALQDLEASGVFRSEWLERLGEGKVEPDPSDVAFLTNVLAASMDRKTSTE